MTTILKYTITLLTILISTISCNTLSYYRTVNDMSNIASTLTMTSGTTIQVMLTVQLDRNWLQATTIQYTTKLIKTPITVPLDSIKEIIIKGEPYLPRNITIGIGTTVRKRLVKRLTEPTSKLHLLEYKYRDETLHDDASNSMHNYNQVQYYYLLATDNTGSARNIEGKATVPNFDEKVSNYLSDCPTVASKIKAKEKGYFYAQITMNSNKRLITWYNIIDAYNTCD